VEALLAFVERSLAQRDLGKQVTVERIMERLSRIAARAQLETDDLNLLRFLLGKHEGQKH
jgi:tRNA C32,U32 (ribose-2'-O)-methylase TrmJ